MAVQKCDSRFLVKWCFLSTFHVTSPLRENNDFVSWFSLQGRMFLPMTMYSCDPLCRILHFWNVIQKKNWLKSCCTNSFSCWIAENIHMFQGQFFLDDDHVPFYFLFLYKGKGILVSWPFDFCPDSLGIFNHLKLKTEDS